MRSLATSLLLLSIAYFIHAQDPEPTASMTTFPVKCSLPADEGTSPDGNFMIYLHYDSSKDKCMPFRYFGTGGNDNRFVNERECMRNCSSEAAKLYPLPDREACHLSKASGECLGQYVRYYYDPIHEKCKSFVWTGCVGNGNRFLDKQQCNSTCFGIKDEGDDPEEDEADTPIGLILGLVFGLTGAAILVTVIVLAVKTKSNKKKSPPRGAEASPPLQDPAAQEDRIEMS